SPQLALRQPDGVARPESYAVEGTAVGPQRDLVLGSAVQIVEHHSRQTTPGQATQVLDVDGTGRCNRATAGHGASPLPVPCGLQAEELRIQPTASHELLVRPLVDQLPAPQDQHLVVAALQPFGHRVGQAAACRLTHSCLVVQRLHLAHPDVLLQDEIVAHEVLENHADVLAQADQVIVAQVDTVEQDATFVRVV